MSKHVGATTPHTLAEVIPTTCTLADLCRVLQISRRTLERERSRDTFPIPEIEPRIGHPRFAGVHVQAYLEGRAAPRRVRRLR